MYVFLTYNTNIINWLFFYRGDSKTIQCGNLVVTLWRDNHVVRVMSTNSQTT